MVKIVFIDKARSNQLKVTSAWFTKKIAAIARSLPELNEFTSLTVVLVGAAEGQALNKTHRRKNYATDVLSFAAVEEGSLGELVFCSPVLKSQAKEHKLREKEELLYLLIHGVLHLLGYDHEKSDKEARVMYRLQDRIFEQLR